jgi:hypothetical protein
MILSDWFWLFFGIAVSFIFVAAMPHGANN